jgi:tol-pal system protein YbgF
MSLLAAGGLAALLSGCATQTAVGKVQQDIDRVQAHLWVLSQELRSVDSLLQAQQAEAQQRWTESSTDDETLSQQVDRLQARLDDVAGRVKDLSQGVESNRLYSPGKAAGSRRAAPGSAVPKGGGPDSTRGPEPSLIADPQGLYRLALDDMEARNYPWAVSEFSQFLEIFPQDDLADNAAYWLGECYYAQKEFPKAVAAFQRVLVDYPKGDKVPAAMLKLGYTYPEVKEKAKGVELLRELVQKHPDSEEARLAKERLSAPAKKGGRR